MGQAADEIRRRIMTIVGGSVAEAIDIGMLDDSIPPVVIADQVCLTAETGLRRWSMGMTDLWEFLAEIKYGLWLALLEWRRRRPDLGSWVSWRRSSRPSPNSPPKGRWPTWPSRLELGCSHYGASSRLPSSQKRRHRLRWSLPDEVFGNVPAATRQISWGGRPPPP